MLVPVRLLMTMKVVAVVVDMVVGMRWNEGMSVRSWLVVDNDDG
jgi:hypothetical protein